jgi:hypothetical protein
MDRKSPTNAMLLQILGLCPEVTLDARSLVWKRLTWIS